jgi:uncharacterized protein YciI
MIVFRYAYSDPTKPELRQQFHADHKAHIRNAPFRVIASGPAYRFGSEETAAALLIAEVEAVEDVAAFSARDPFVLQGVYAHVAIFEWRPGIDLTSSLSVTLQATGCAEKHTETFDFK